MGNEERCQAGLGGRGREPLRCSPRPPTTPPAGVGRSTDQHEISATGGDARVPGGGAPARGAAAGDEHFARCALLPLYYPCCENPRAHIPWPLRCRRCTFTFRRYVFVLCGVDCVRLTRSLTVYRVRTMSVRHCSYACNPPSLFIVSPLILTRVILYWFHCTHLKTICPPSPHSSSSSLRSCPPHFVIKLLVHCFRALGSRSVCTERGRRNLTTTWSWPSTSTFRGGRDSPASQGTRAEIDQTEPRIRKSSH